MRCPNHTDVAGAVQLTQAAAKMTPGVINTGSTSEALTNEKFVRTVDTEVVFVCVDTTGKRYTTAEIIVVR